MTDKWISMGDKSNKKEKIKLLKPYQVNKKIMKLANPMQFLCIVCQLIRGFEVTSEVMDGKQSVVWLEALNRIHIQKVLFNGVLNKYLLNWQGIFEFSFMYSITAALSFSFFNPAKDILVPFIQSLGFIKKPFISSNDHFFPYAAIALEYL